MITGYSILIEDDGTPSIRLEVPHGVEAARQPTLRDLRRSVLEIGADLDARAAADWVLQKTAPVQENPAERVAAALQRSREES